MRPLLLALGVSLLGTAAAHATEYPTSRCSFTAFVAAPDPEGINLRSGPGFSHGIVGRLPPKGHHVDDSSLPAMVEVEVLDAKDGWFQIRNAKDNVELHHGRRASCTRATAGSAATSLRSTARHRSPAASRRRGLARSPRKMVTLLSWTSRAVMVSSIARAVGPRSSSVRRRPARRVGWTSSARFRRPPVPGSEVKIG